MDERSEIVALSEPQLRLLEAIVHWPYPAHGYTQGDRRRSTRTAEVLLRRGFIEEVSQTARSTSYRATDAGRQALRRGRAT